MYWHNVAMLLSNARQKIVMKHFFMSRDHSFSYLRICLSIDLALYFIETKTCFTGALEWNLYISVMELVFSNSVPCIL